MESQYQAHSLNSSSSATVFLNRICQQYFSTEFVYRIFQQYFSIEFVYSICQLNLSTVFLNSISQQYLSTEFVSCFTKSRPGLISLWILPTPHQCNCISELRFSNVFTNTPYTIHNTHTNAKYSLYYKEHLICASLYQLLTFCLLALMGGKFDLKLHQQQKADIHWR